MANQLQTNLELISKEKTEKIIPENIKKDVQIFDVTGSLEGLSFNVYMQNSEPINKDGIWIKNNSKLAGAKFYNYTTVTGEFLEASKFNFLKRTEGATSGIGIIDGYMYITDAAGTNSVKINLNTKVISNINVIGHSANYLLGSCVYNSKLYVFTYGGTSSSGNDHTLRAYCYDSVSDIMTYVSSASINRDDYTFSSGQRRGVYVYEKKAYIFSLSTDSYIGGKNVAYTTFDLETNKFGSLMKVSKFIDSPSTICGYGNHVYWAEPTFYSGYLGGKFCEMNLLDNTLTEYDLGRGSGLGNLSPYAVNEDIVYLFHADSKEQTEYIKYNLKTKTFEKVLAGNSYYVKRGTTLPMALLDDKTGILYFRSWAGEVQPCGMQFTDSPIVSSLSDNTAVVIESFYENIIKIEDQTNMHVGLENVYLKTIDGLISKPVFLGNGETWEFYKNLSGETATITFDTDGGSTINPIEVVIGQKIGNVNTPSKAGYAFSNWYLNGKPFDFSKPIVEDLTLVAGWETYEVIECIKSTGTQYINTGFTPNQDTKVEMEVMFNDITSAENLWCARGESNANSFVMFKLQTNFRCDYNATLGTIDNFTIVPNTKYKVCMDKNEVYIDDNLLYTHEEATFMAPDSLTLMMSYVTSHNNNQDNFGHFKMYSCKIYDNGVLVRNFVPIKTEKGTVGLLDQVNNVAYYNAGTGTFEVLDDINNYTQLEYIESTGT